jgi:hypothetical protein
MGKGGRYGKYGEQKRFERLRQRKKDSFPFPRPLSGKTEPWRREEKRKKEKGPKNR